MGSEVLVSISNLRKSFGKVLALDGVSFELRKGEVHALLGENGAGKSTLIKIISGVFAPDEGTMSIKGQQVSTYLPKKARDSGVATVFQELSLVNELSVEDNIFLGHAVSKSTGALDRPYMRSKTEELLKYVGLDVSPQAKVGTLGSAQQQLVEIAKALSTDPDIVIMDEPTDKLYGDEQQQLYRIIAKLREDDKGIIYISHKLEEILLVADRVTVLRDGKYISTADTKGVTHEQLISMMVGRDIGSLFPKETVPVGEDVLVVENLSCGGYLKNISFSVKSGEILGIGGLVGSGRTMMAQCIAGVLKASSGRVLVDGEEIILKSPSDAIKSRIAYLPEDRKRYGLVLGMSCLDNIILPSIPSFVIDKKKLVEASNGLVSKLSMTLWIFAPIPS